MKPNMHVTQYPEVNRSHSGAHSGCFTGDVDTPQAVGYLMGQETPVTPEQIRAMVQRDPSLLQRFPQLQTMFSSVDMFNAGNQYQSQMMQYFNNGNHQTGVMVEVAHQDASGQQAAIDCLWVKRCIFIQFDVCPQKLAMMDEQKARDSLTWHFSGEIKRANLMMEEAERRGVDKVRDNTLFASHWTVGLFEISPGAYNGCYKPVDVRVSILRRDYMSADPEATQEVLNMVQMPKATGRRPSTTVLPAKQSMNYSYTIRGEPVVRGTFLQEHCGKKGVESIMKLLSNPTTDPDNPTKRYYELAADDPVMIWLSQQAEDEVESALAKAQVSFADTQEGRAQQEAYRARITNDIQSKYWRPHNMSKAKFYVEADRAERTRKSILADWAPVITVGNLVPDPTLSKTSSGLSVSIWPSRVRNPGSDRSTAAVDWDPRNDPDLDSQLSADADEAARDRMASRTYTVSMNLIMEVLVPKQIL